MKYMLQYIINLIVFIPITIILIVASIKLSKLNSDHIDKYKYVKVLERVSLNKDNSVFVLKIGDEGCVIASSPSKIETIKQLSKDEVIEIENMKPEFGLNMTDIDIDKFNIFNIFNIFRPKYTRNKGINSLTFKKNNLNLLSFNRSNRSMFNKKNNKLNFKRSKYGRFN